MLRCFAQQSLEASTFPPQHRHEKSVGVVPMRHRHKRTFAIEGRADFRCMGRERHNPQAARLGQNRCNHILSGASNIPTSGARIRGLSCSMHVPLRAWVPRSARGAK